MLGAEPFLCFSLTPAAVGHPRQARPTLSLPLELFISSHTQAPSLLRGPAPSRGPEGFWNPEGGRSPLTVAQTASGPGALQEGWLAFGKQAAQCRSPEWSEEGPLPEHEEHARRGERPAVRVFSKLPAFLRSHNNSSQFFKK